jgi:hypothetical protein
MAAHRAGQRLPKDRRIRRSPQFGAATPPIFALSDGRQSLRLGERPRNRTTSSQPGRVDAAPHVRPEPLKRRRITTPAKRFAGASPRTLLLIADGLFEVVPGILSGAGATTFDEIRLGKEVQKTSGGVPLIRKPDVPPRGTPKGYEGGDASSSSPLTSRTYPESLWRNNDIRRTSRIATGNPPGGTP